MLHPDAEAYRRALAAGDHTTAGALLMSAHAGTYDSRKIDDFHRVARMTRAELEAAYDSGAAADIPVDKNETGRVTVTARLFGRR